MEHRWGIRIQSDLPIRLDISSRTVDARITDVSLSGAFVEVSERIPPEVSVEVQFDLMRSKNSKLYRAAARVVRRTEQGVALEWFEFAPRVIRTLCAVLRIRAINLAHANRPPEAASTAYVPGYQPLNRRPRGITLTM
jgi:PilZ domain